MLRKEVSRFARLWSQTLLPSVVTTILYFAIFGKFIGSQVQPIEGVSYIQFIVAGLVMMAVIMNSFQNVIASFFFSKFQRSIEEMLVSPLPYWALVAGYILGGLMRGLAVGILVLLTALFFTHLVVYNIWFVLIFIILTSVFFSLLGLLNGLFAKNFDQVQIVPTFVLTPLIYLGGVFYSIEFLPPLWQKVSLFNPILYMIDGLRYGFLGIADVSPWVSLILLLIFTGVSLGLVLYFFKKGYGLRS